jgi:hypothetical protein
MKKVIYPFENFSQQNIPGEKWKDIKGFEGLYRISNFGRIKTYKKRLSDPDGLHKPENWRLLAQIKVKFNNNNTGQDYFQLHVNLMKDRKTTTLKPARLVYYHFVEAFNLKNRKLNIEPKDGNNLNCHYKNLRLTTRSAILSKMYKDEIKRRPGKEISCYDIQGKLVATFASILEAKRQTKVSAYQISRQINGHNKDAYRDQYWREGSKKRIEIKPVKKAVKKKK